MSSNKKKNGGRIAIIVVCGILALILVVVLSVYLILKSYLGKINHAGKEDWSVVETTDVLEPSTDENGVEINPSMPDDINSQGAAFIENGDVKDEGYVKNIVFIGTDNRHFENILVQPGNADTIIVVSINTKTNKIYLTSIMRDTAAYIAYSDDMKSKHSNWKDGYDKINAANARGGPEFLLDTIEANFKIKVDDYVLVDFYSLIDIIDILGGIEVTLTDEVAAAANNYIRDMDFDRGISNWETANILDGGGTLLLNGVQAVGYARERQTTGSDYARTERQREVLDKLFAKAKKMSLTQLDSIAKTILPKVWTNMPDDKILGMVAESITYLGYSVEQVRIPFDNMFTTPNGNLLPDYGATVDKLHSIIYGE